MFMRLDLGPVEVLPFLSSLIALSLSFSRMFCNITNPCAPENIFVHIVGRIIACSKYFGLGRAFCILVSVRLIYIARPKYQRTSRLQCGSACQGVLLRRMRVNPRTQISHVIGADDKFKIH